MALQSVTVKPSENDASCVEWCRKVLEAQTIIGINVVESIALKICVCKTASEMLERLETLYGKRSQSTKDELHMQFFAYKYDYNKTAIDNCLAIDGLAQELGAIGAKIKDDWIISRILNSLPERFIHFHSAWDSTVSTDKTISKLMARLQQEEQRIKLRDGNSVESALISKGKNNKLYNKTHHKKNLSQWKGNQNQSLSNYNNKCFKCGKVGHQKSQCHGKPCQEYLDYCKRNYKCNNCQEVGHFIKECPKLQKEDVKAFILIALSATEIEQISDDHKS
ncbi:uncharacterized protein LOC120359102 [Solenopsis invicta]|uniref:uncharacterized protein LOC120359102 n=1 Tax=Solenopsis invicta TaxID=13686 RepID=UPI00193D9B4D|nr:uncharacterized protein LOC120359102 [Solenopsis invicta]